MCSIICLVVVGNVDIVYTIYANSIFTYNFEERCTEQLLHILLMSYVQKHSGV